MIKKKTLVIGASLNEERYSNKAIKKLVANNHPTLAIGLKKAVLSSVLIETEKKIFKNINTVTLYLNPKKQKEYYDYIIKLQPNRVIFNPGTENFEFTKLLEEKNISFEFSCTLVLLATNQY